MTIEALVAEALHETPVFAVSTPKSLTVNVRGPIEEAASAFLATPAGQTLARWAAIGEAVERLEAATPDGGWAELSLDREDIPSKPWRVFGGGEDDSIPEPAYSAWGPTITDAINAALGDEG
jgi:hypothetical protein